MRLFSFLCILGLMAGCGAPPPAPSATPEPVASVPTASPTSTPAYPASTSEDEGAQLHFDRNQQWYVPKAWTGEDRWLTPEGILVKYWIVSRGEKELDSKEVARLFEATCEMTNLSFTKAPAPEAQDDFHLWMLHGTARKKNARKQVEPVVWQACLVEPLHPVRVSGYHVVTSIGPPGSESECQKALLQLTRTIERSKTGASPPRIKVQVQVTTSPR